MFLFERSKIRFVPPIAEKKMLKTSGGVCVFFDASFPHFLLNYITTSLCFTRLVCANPQQLHRDKLIELAALRIRTLYPQNNFINEFAFNLSKQKKKIKKNNAKEYAQQLIFLCITFSFLFHWKRKATELLRFGSALLLCFNQKDHWI